MDRTSFPYTGQFVAVLGAGRSGLAAARLLARLGARVLLSESRTLSPRPRLPAGVELETGRHSPRVLNAVLLVRSPGIPDHLPILRQARKKKIPIWSELELASRLIHPKQLIAITGTNGKTTTTTLAGALFKAVNTSTWLAGNIGTPLADLADKIRPNSNVVLEASSYQLENIERFHPTISAILNITPDHLDHHGTMRAYAAAKARVFENQGAGDTCVLNADDPWCRTLAKGCRARVLWFSRKRKLKQGIYYVPSSPNPFSLRREKGVIIPLPTEGEGGRRPGEGFVVINWHGFHARFPLHWDLPGPHNVENALAAIAIAVAGKIPVATIQKVLKRFKGVEHRLEPVRLLRGVRYINDSKATNVDSTRVALESFQTPLVLIMGGRGKGAPYAPLRALVKHRARRLLLIGEDAGRIGKDLGRTVPFENVKAMPQAVKRAAQIAVPGDTVLLSPACASFDQYGNYEERGRHFKQLVRGLRGSA